MLEKTRNGCYKRGGKTGQKYGTGAPRSCVASDYLEKKQGGMVLGKKERKRNRLSQGKDRDRKGIEGPWRKPIPRKKGKSQETEEGLTRNRQRQRLKPTRRERVY